VTLTLFPRAFEFEVIETRWVEYRKMLAALDLATYGWRAGRSMLFMKDQVSFRRATQFDPVDSILFGALIWTVAPEIEARRPARALNAVFSYRFEASSTGQLFAPFKAKQAFWTHTADACKEEGAWLLTTDIADFYNQIRHSSLKSDLDASRLPSARSCCWLASFARSLGSRPWRRRPTLPTHGCCVHSSKRQSV